MHFFALAESSVTNSLGRAISLSLVAAELGTVELWALDDGPTWTGARHFDLPIHRFTARRINELVAAISERARTEQVIVWISKGLSPLDRIGHAVHGTPGVIVIADFDDDDVSLMQEQMREIGQDRGASERHPPEVTDPGAPVPAANVADRRRLHVLERDAPRGVPAAWAPGTFQRDHPAREADLVVGQRAPRASTRADTARISRYRPTAQRGRSDPQPCRGDARHRVLFLLRVLPPCDRRRHLALPSARTRRCRTSTPTSTSPSCRRIRTPAPPAISFPQKLSRQPHSQSRSWRHPLR